MSFHDRRKGLLARAVVLALSITSLAAPAVAQVVKRGGSDLDKLSMASRQLRRSRTLTDADAVKQRLAYRDDLDRFRSEYGKAWRFLIDERTAHVNLVEGGAIPFIPAPGNQLPPPKIESLAREFLTRNRRALQVEPEELVLAPAGTAPVGNTIYFVRFQWVHGGVPVEGGSVFLAINNGNLVQIGLQDLGDIKLDPKPGISAEKAWQILRAYVKARDEKDEVLDRGSLTILPVTPKGLDPDARQVPFGKMIDYVLAYKLAFRRPGVLGTWEGLVDAHTGELLRFRDANKYGHIQGGVYKTDAPQTEVTMPFPKADFGAGTYANESGDFPATGGTSTMTGLNAGSPGVAGGVDIVDTCGAISLAASGGGLIDFGNQAGAGTDCTTPGFGGAGNTHAARTQYWNVSEIKMKGISYLPANAWLQGQLQDVVNINDVCNAYWDDISLNVNFFHTGTIGAGVFGPYTQTCGNTGELPGVSLHEWGHGMDSNDGSGFGTDNVPVETRADWTAILQTHQSCTGGGFATARSPLPSYGLNCGGYGNPCTACTGIRDADFSQHTHATAWTPQNNGQADPGYSCSGGFYNGPCGWEDHCESGIATQALWDFVNRDVVGAPSNLDLVTAWQLADRLFYTGMPQSTNMYTCTGTPKVSNGCGAGSLYTVMRAIDDDGDGTGNGTPHAAAIFAALNRHGIACGAAGDATNQNQTSCPALTTPTLTASADSHQVNLTWTTGGASATRYFVFRNETGCNSGFTRIATVNAPTLTYTDTGVVHGLTYYYRLQAATANDSCVSPMSGCSTVTVSLPADQDFYVRDWTSTPASFDDGAQPSTNPVFWHTSDVWNRGTNSAGTPNASGWYDTDNMFAGTGPEGDNYAFVRVHRNTTGSAATVTAHFLVSPFGTGSSFLDAAATTDPTLGFAAGDGEAVLASGYLWHQDDIASTHACLAVEISTPADPIGPPGGLFGKTPGPDDYIVVNDNNKAQRNLDVSHNVMHFAARSFALVHNAALFPRDMVLRFESPAAEQLQGAKVEVVGGRAVDFRSGGTIALEGMQPGENRWIAVTHQETKGNPLPIHFLELDKERAANGFTVLAQAIPLAQAIRENLRDHRQAFNRLAAAFVAEKGKAEGLAAEKLLRQEKISPAQYLAFLAAHSKAMTAILEPVVAKGGKEDAFGALKTLSSLADMVRRKQPEQAAAVHGRLLNELDSLATMLQKAQGDPADILQMVRWQEALYRTRPDLHRLDCSERVVKDSQEFIRTYARRKPDLYPALLRTLSACFHETAKVLQKDQEPLEKSATALEAPGLSLTALEKIHREFLLALQDAAGPVQR
jgi:hypothetical protein